MCDASFRIGITTVMVGGVGSLTLGKLVGLGTVGDFPGSDRRGRLRRWDPGFWHHRGVPC